MNEQGPQSRSEPLGSSGPQGENRVDEPLARWRRRANDSVTLGTSGSTDLVAFEKQTKRLAVPFSSLAYVLLKTNVKRHDRETEQLTVAFGSHVVSIWGERLRELQDAFCERSIAVVRMAPPSASMIEEKAAVVRELDWVETKDDSEGVRPSGTV